MITISVCCSLLLLFCSSMAAVTQDVLTSIEGSIKDNEPTWQLSAREQQPKSIIYRWKAGKEIVVAEVFVTSSKQAASDLLQEHAFRVPIPPKQKLKSLGDEALLYQSGNAANGMILFRRSNVFILLTGSSVPNARRFANHIVNVIPER